MNCQRLCAHGLLVVTVACADSSGRSGAPRVPSEAPSREAPAVEAPESEAPRIELSEVAEGRWRAAYRFFEPVHGLEFARVATLERDENWIIRTPGYAWVREDDQQRVVLQSGQPVDTIVIDIPVDVSLMPRDYEVFNVFTDGSLAIYTGHLYAAPLLAAGAAEVLTTLAIDPGRGRRAVLGGIVHDDVTQWTESGVRGTYAYLGNIEPVTTPHVVGIFDPGLPSWARDVAEASFPEVFELFTKRTGHALAARPQVLFSFDPAASAQNVNGGTLTDLVQLRMQGRGWEDSADARHQLLHTVAHEAAHLWNAQLAVPDEATPSWVHEGSADAFAAHALEHLRRTATEGVAAFDPSAWRVRSARQDALNHCNVFLGDTALNETPTHRNHYSCGSLLAWWADEALRAARPSRDFFSFWAALIERAQSNGGSYDMDDYFVVLEELGVPKETLTDMRKFASEPQGAPAEFMRQALAPYGVRIRRDDSLAPARASQQEAARMLLALLAGDCRKYGLYAQAQHVELAGLEGCSVAREGIKFARIGSVPLGAPAFAAARHAIDRCSKHQRVLVGLHESREQVELPCPKLMPPISGFWVVED